MKLILIPDNLEHPFSSASRPKVAISIPGDDYTINEILEKLVTPALVAMSFCPRTIQEGYHDADVVGPEAPAGRPTTLILPPLPPAPEGFESWTEPELVPDDTRPCRGTMGFFHARPGSPDTDWIVCSDGTFGGATDYPVYFIRALEAQPEFPDAPEPPIGFTVAGFDCVLEGWFESEDVMYTYRGHSWFPTAYINGSDVWYALRTGSETQRTVLALLAARP